MKFLKWTALAAALAYLAAAAWPGEPVKGLPAGVEASSGDIILLGSATVRGKLLKIVDGGTMWCHAGVLERGDGGAIYIIHADPGRGAVRERLDEYLRQNHTDAIAILRPRAAVYPSAGQTAAEAAAGYARRREPFKNSFRYGCGTGVYCTELAIDAWRAAGVEILPPPAKGDKIKPSGLYDSSRLETIWQSL